MSRIKVILLIVVVAELSAKAATAQLTDVVVMQGSTSSSKVTMQCQVKDYNGRWISVVTKKGGTEKRYPSAEVISVKTFENAAHRSGLANFKSGNLKKATTSFEEALQDEPRQWVRRELLAWLVRCALVDDDFITAGTRFRALYKSDSDTRHISIIPVMWTDRTLDSITETTATAWSRDSEPIMRLIGASLLLNIPTSEKHADEVLRSLGRSVDDNVRLLSAWQRRRLRIRSGQIGDSDLISWESRIPKLKSSLRSGPYFLLGQAHLTRQQYELAAGEFLRLPLVHDSHHPVVAQAMFEAARSLATIGQVREASRLYQEVVSRYGLTRVSIAARAALKELAASGK